MHKSGGKVQVWVCNGKPQQQWKVEGDALVNVGGPSRDVWSKISQFFVTPNNIAEFDKHRNEAKMWFERFLWPDVRRILNQENVPYGTVDEAFNRLVDALYEPLFLNADSVLHLHNSLSPSTRTRTRTRNLANDEEFTYCDALIADTIKGGLEVLFSVMGLIKGPAQRLAHDLYKSFVEMIGKQDMKILALLILQADRKALTAGILTTVISKINFSMLFKEIDGLVLTGDLAIAIAIDIFVQVIRFIANPVYAIALSLGLALIALVDVIATLEEYTEGCCNNECSENKICEAGQCISPGFPRFTLSWYGDDDIDLHVWTPGGVEIDWENPDDPQTGGSIDVDKRPASVDNNVENIVFPAGPHGSYRVQVVIFTQINTNDGWTLKIYDPFLKATYTGVGNSAVYSYYKPF